MKKNELCFVCVPFISECNTRRKGPNSAVDYSALNMTVCDGVEQAGFIPVSPLHLWSYCFKDIYGRYDKERIIQAGFRLIELCECFYFCDCIYNVNTHEEMDFWRLKAQMLNKRFVLIDKNL
ncbi:MAG: hypothetical protein ACTTIV_02120 [Campylobacter sp.]